MSQHIVLLSYTGSSTYTYDVSCDGHKLPPIEAVHLGFTSRGELERHKQSNYIPDWYEIKPGTRIRIDHGELGVEISTIYVVPKNGLPDPPVSLDDERCSPRLHEYLEQYCRMEILPAR